MIPVASEISVLKFVDSQLNLIQTGHQNKTRRDGNRWDRNLLINATKNWMWALATLVLAIELKSTSSLWELKARTKRGLSCCCDKTPFLCIWCASAPKQFKLWCETFQNQSLNTRFIHKPFQMMCAIKSFTLSKYYYLRVSNQSVQARSQLVLNPKSIWYSHQHLHRKLTIEACTKLDSYLILLNSS